jgi:DNA-binding winged helix-turn-helix (wHTH) protein/TolB-like protein
MAESAYRLRVGDWIVERDLNQLSAPGKAVRIEPKAMEVLPHLARQPGQVTSREELLAQVWPGVVVGDDSLTQVIIKLRKALGDDPDRPTYIQTVTKRGYRLVASVVPLVEPASSPASRRARRARWMAGAATAGLLVAAGLWWSLGERTRHPTHDAGLAAEVTGAPTLAIAPFQALGKDSFELLLARGITADLLTDLSKSSGLSVIGFSPLDGRAGGEATGHAEARYLVSGTVQRIDDRLRLHVHLREQSTGKQPGRSGTIAPGRSRDPDEPARRSSAYCPPR